MDSILGVLDSGKTSCPYRDSKFKFTVNINSWTLSFKRETRIGYCHKHESISYTVQLILRNKFFRNRREVRGLNTFG
jgi:hypothetical protein